ncbi:SCRB1 protein, partial [Pseudoatta argentina]
MKFIASLFGTRSPKAMGRQYMKVGRNALFGVTNDNSDNICIEKVPRPLFLLISRKGKFRHGRIAAICLGLLALISYTLVIISAIHYCFTLSTQSKSLPRLITMGLSIFLSGLHMKPFIPITAQELVFGYDDPLVSLGHKFLPKTRRPMSRMGLLLGRNGTLSEISTIFTGHTNMKEFGLINRLNGLDHLPYWPNAPCNSITASEGSFFPPRDQTGADIIHVWDKDFCRTLPLQYRGPIEKAGIKADLYTPTDVLFTRNETAKEDNCFCSDGIDSCPPQGLQDISPCQYSIPVYLSFPHFYKADPKLLDAIDGLKPINNLHKTYFKIQPKLGVPLEAKVRVQLNLKIEQHSNIGVVANFPDIIFPIMWIEEGIEELTPSIRRYIYLATTFADIAVPCLSYGMVLVGLIVIITVFVKAYNSPVLAHEAIELGKRTIRRGSSFLTTSQHRLMVGRDSYILLSNNDIDEKQSMEV